MNLNDLAPYPRTETDASADALVKHLAVCAQAALREAASDGSAKPPTRVVDAYGLVFLLRALQAYAPARVEFVARRLWRHWEDGDAPREWLWHWLTEYGINPQQVNEIVDASRPHTT